MPLVEFRAFQPFAWRALQPSTCNALGRKINLTTSSPAATFISVNCNLNLLLSKALLLSTAAVGF
jgi:hypothetical protein